MSDEVHVSRPLPTVSIGGFPTVALTRKELAAVMVSDCLEARANRETWLPKLVFSSNGQGIALAGRNSEFADAMRGADIVHADGTPVVFASKMTSTPLPETISTTDYFHDAAQVAGVHRLKFFLLGARDEQNAAAVAASLSMYPDVEIVGRHHGYFGEEDDEVICQMVRDSGADVLWVALGKPRQEYWCVRNRARLHGVGWIKTCGGLFSFLTGDARRAPRWMRAAGLEWFYRTLYDPRRLAWRYLTTNPYAVYRLLRYTERFDKRGVHHS